MSQHDVDARCLGILIGPKDLLAFRTNVFHQLRFDGTGQSLLNREAHAPLADLAIPEPGHDSRLVLELLDQGRRDQSGGEPQILHGLVGATVQYFYSSRHRQILAQRVVVEEVEKVDEAEGFGYAMKRGHFTPNVA